MQSSGLLSTAPFSTSHRPKARLGSQTLKVGARRLASTVTVLTPATNTDCLHCMGVQRRVNFPRSPIQFQPYSHEALMRDFDCDLFRPTSALIRLRLVYIVQSRSCMRR